MARKGGEAGWAPKSKNRLRQEAAEKDAKMLAKAEESARKTQKECERLAAATKKSPSVSIEKLDADTALAKALRDATLEFGFEVEKSVVDSRVR